MNKPVQLSGIMSERDLDFELFFVTDILKLESLHYGYWDNPPLRPCFDLREIRKAQQRYTEALLDKIPQSSAKVLDVGCGIGAVSRELARRGHRVTALSPDRNHRRYFSAMNDPNIAFRQTTFESFESHGTYDAILFSESHNYIPPKNLWSQVRKLISDTGRVVLSGMFRQPDRSAHPDDYCVRSHSFFQLAEAAGMELVELDDITERVLPTMEMVHQALQDYLEPIAEFGARYLSAISPWKARAVWCLGGRELRKLDEVKSYYLERTDPDYFRRHIRYVSAVWSPAA